MTEPNSKNGKPQSKLKSAFNHFARVSARVTGHPVAFLVAVAIILVWACTGPLFKFNDTWQLVINTGTTIITFLMVFLIQNAQNRDSLALQLKMDEVIRAVQGAHNHLMNLEELEDEELEAMHKRYAALAERARKMLDQGQGDVGCPEVEEVEDAKEEAKHEVDVAARDVKQQVKSTSKPAKKSA